MIDAKDVSDDLGRLADDLDRLGDALDRLVAACGEVLAAGRDIQATLEARPPAPAPGSAAGLPEWIGDLLNRRTEVEHQLRRAANAGLPIDPPTAKGLAILLSQPAVPSNQAEEINEPAPLADPAAGADPVLSEPDEEEAR